ncbi:hypothetical protein R1flu_001155 [Riccia fluitans]|uniref:Uncharacterized protein n=1 Tax=Riccia fluitans TaxID=41844 RepID=A0ABD1Y2J0_9MARC
MADKAAGRRLPTIRLMDEELYNNTDAEGDRLLVKDARDGTNIIGWNEIAVIFGAKHNDKEDFLSIKMMHTTIDKYNPRAYLPTSVEHNPNKKLVSG